MNKYLENYLNVALKIFLFLIFLFARTFTGVYIFGFRLGELLVGGLCFLLIAYLLFYPIKTGKYFLDVKALHLALCFLVILFLFNVAKNNSNFANFSIYKTSSYIWTIGALILGIEIVKYLNIHLNKYDIVLSIVGLATIYLFSTKGISENRQNFILNFTDKFEYPKGSDILLAFIFIFIFILNKLNYSKLGFNLLSINFALIAPVLMVKSRSAFISLVIFLLLLIPYFRNSLRTFDKKLLLTITASIVVFILSTSWVVSRDLVIDEDISEELKFAITSRYQTINDNVYEKEFLKLKLFYLEDGRIFTTDGNLNWRFQIWQDIFSDMWNTKYFLFGYGYEDLIPAMDNDQRYGQDQQNINVHNYFVHIFSRGGITSLLVVLLFYLYLYRVFKANNLKLDFLQIFIPLIFNSLFDPCMENAHYSVIFYLLLGLTFNKYIIFNRSKI